MAKKEEALSKSVSRYLKLQFPNIVFTCDASGVRLTMGQATSLKAQRWDSGINGLLKVSFFAAPSTSVAIYAGMPSAVALLVGAGISLTASVVLSSQQRNKVKIDNPYTYLLSLNNQW